MANFIYSIITNLPIILIGIIGIGFIIGFHELGHFIFCKIFKVKTPSFSIGFGPKIFSKKIGETVFSLSAIPFGGYVEIAGNQEVGQGEQKEAYSQNEDSFAVKPYYQKLLIMSGGILFNILLSYLLMIVLFGLGAPKIPMLNADSIIPTISRITPNSAAEKYGLRENDTILMINQNEIKSSQELHNTIKYMADKEAIVTIARDGKNLNISLTVGSTGSGSEKTGQLGIQFASSFEQPVSFLKAINKGFKTVNLLIIKTIQQYIGLFKNKLYGSVGGPLMMISAVSNSAKDGLRAFLLLLIIVNLNLAILNLIPIPILDGGQILLTTIEAIIRRPIPENIRIGIHYVCWILAIILTIWLSYNDIFRFLK